LQILVWDEGLLYWIVAGRDGILEIMGQIVPDDEDFSGEIEDKLDRYSSNTYLM